MSIRRNFSAAVAVAVLGGLLAGGSLDPAARADAAAASPVTTQPSSPDGDTRGSTEPLEQRKKKRPISARNPFVPRTGVAVNDPLSRDKGKRGLLNQQLMKTIKSIPAGERIRISEWNIDSNFFVRNALAAHRRGVSVQLLMSGGVASRQNPQTGTVAQLRRGFKKAGNAKRTPGQRSFIRVCQRSCRGALGIEHAKFVIVSKTGRSGPRVRRNISSVSSANITAAAALNQWNDTFTTVGEKPVYDFFQRLFTEMVPDRNRRTPYKSFSPASPGYIRKVWANPYNGKDPVLNVLNRVRCRGLASGVGERGRTVVRVAQTVLDDGRGTAIARKLAGLKRDGCAVRVVYTLMSPDARNVLAGAGVAHRQLARDTNGDGFYDKYLHTKLLSIDGRMGKNRRVHFVRNGSENWNQMSRLSDEVGFDMVSPRFEGRYSNYMDMLFRISSSGYTPPPPPTARGTFVDPFRFVEIY